MKLLLFYLNMNFLNKNNIVVIGKPITDAVKVGALATTAITT